jgi:hypothetical protein
MTIATILLLIALILFVCASLGVSTRIHLGWAGMACFVASLLVAGGAII